VVFIITWWSQGREGLNPGQNRYEREISNLITTNPQTKIFTGKREENPRHPSWTRNLS